MKKTLPFIERDSWLWPVSEVIERRHNAYLATKNRIEEAWGGLYGFASAHLYFGLHYRQDSDTWVFREWLPNARHVFLCGDFNHWDQTSHALERKENGVWQIEMPASSVPGLKHLSRYKMYVQDCHGSWKMRLPAYTFYAVQDEASKDFSAALWHPGKDFRWNTGTHEIRPQADFSRQTPLIYEAHIGMAQEKEGVGTYAEFRQNVLPRIKDAGYNVVQLMGIAEHPYYGSFGYHVSNFFAPSSRFGTPDDLKELIRTAHEMGLFVVMDVVHAHFVENVNEGLNRIDGSDDLYSYGGSAGTHPYWGSRMFNFGRDEIKRFLLSNLRYWLEEFHFDGFRFDGVTAMIYYHRGYVDNFGTYQNYFGSEVDENALVYLSLANDLIREMRPGTHLSIAEEVSGMPGMTVATQEGGYGFDYRLSMGIPDYWIKIIKERRDEDWIMSELWHTVTDRIGSVPQIAYSESHDQALVGDQTLAFRLMGAHMYTQMSIGSNSAETDRGMALLKMIRLISLFAGAEGGGYLNFMGNEFGHPEWIDFPRPGNGESYRYARRQWSLADNRGLKYGFLGEFDRVMLGLARQMNLRGCPMARLLSIDEENKTIVFSVKDTFLFVFNWHVNRSLPDYRIPVAEEGRYRLILCSDEARFGGFSRVDARNFFFTENKRLSIYNINRAAQIFSLVEERGQKM
ncbi:MAG: alpha-amylase family glycosyl hydrolase [Bacteroides sp.]|nr:alpha-amylase family glycosyl hydrolase [Bacteroides sp.]MCM1084823.1 alpha-amylase family glycosyl hydrolase [Bacteroides sp.]